jgi:hypothetical protein
LVFWGGGGGLGGEMAQALYAHMNNKTILKKLRRLKNKTKNQKNPTIFLLFPYNQ